MTDTARLAMHRPVGADQFVPSSDLQDVVDTLDNAAIDQEGTLAARPLATAVVRGTYYFATDEQVVYRSNGTTWTAVTTANPAIDLSGVIGSRPNANTVADGTYYYATDTGVLYRSNATSWFTVGFEADTVKAVRTTDQAIAANTLDQVDFDSTLIETVAGMHSPGDGFVTAVRAGVYAWEVNVFVTSSIAEGAGSIVVNPGSQIIGGCSGAVRNQAANRTVLSASGVAVLAASGTIDPWVRVPSAVNILGDTAGEANRTFLQMTRIAVL